MKITLNNPLLIVALFLFFHLGFDNSIYILTTITNYILDYCRLTFRLLLDYSRQISIRILIKRVSMPLPHKATLDQRKRHTRHWQTDKHAFLRSALLQMPTFHIQWHATAPNNQWRRWSIKDETD